MHKKPLVAVFVLGLFLVTAVAWAAPAPNDVFKRNTTKQNPTPNLQRTLLEPGTPVHIQAGTPLASPGTFCTGNYMGSRYYRYGGTFQGGEIYYVLQDPSLTIPYSWNPAGCGATPYKFNVTAIDFEVFKTIASAGPNPFTFTLQPIVFDADQSTPGCPVPGGVKCAGPVYAVTLTGGGSAGTTFLVNLPFTIECCVNGPYFGATYLAGTWAGDIGEVLTDHICDTPSCTPPAGYIHPPPPLSCHEYIYADNPPWGLYDWNTFYLGPNNFRMYSEGYTPNDPLTQCTPGVCDYQYWNAGSPPAWGRMNEDSANTYFTIPSASGARTSMGVRFVAGGLDTLKSISFKGFVYAGAPDVVVEVWGPGPAHAGATCWPTEPATLLYSVTVPSGSLVDDPLTNDVPIPDIVWGTLNGGLPQDLYVTLRVANGLPNQWAPLGHDFGVSGCGVDPHTVLKYPGSGGWWTSTDWYDDEIEMDLDAYICQEVVPIVEVPCSPAGPDQWPTWAHDYRRTSASSINLGDPCKVRAQWSTFLPRLCSFTNPVVAGGKVYVSSDNEVNSYDLASGAAGNSVNAFPWMGGQVRSNVTVVGNRVFMTGGTGQSVSCFDTTLTTPFWSNDFNGTGLTTTGNGPLNARNRFGVAAVYTVGSDSVVVIGTERPNTTGNGWLYALDVHTGFLYTGWATNPVALDRGSEHSPAYDGTNLYVGTADFGTNNDGSLYSFIAATGVQNWNYKDGAAPLEGWPGGVSVEGNFLYAATFYNDATLALYSGHRYAIDKSGAAPVISWRVSEGPTLYAAPTIGRKFLYIPQDAPSNGLLMVNKSLGNAVYNWSANGVGSIPQNVTLTCDKYLFAGDRGDGWFGHWWLLDVTNQTAVWQRCFGGIVNGTALAHHPITGDDYAIVSGRSSYTGPAGAGFVSGWRFNQTSRPFIHQYVYETDQILVPLNSGDGLGPYIQSGVYGNDGCVNLNITGTNFYDIAPSASNFTETQRQYAAAYADRKLGSDYVTYFEGGKPSKTALRAGALTRADEELTVFDKAMENAHQAFSAKRTRGATAAGAKADILRTHAVTYSANPILPGGITNMSWTYDGTGLGRGVDDEIIETVNDDPDNYAEDLTYANMGYPSIIVHYVGGCPEEYTLLTWNKDGNPNVQKARDHGALGDGKAGSLTWGNDGGWNSSIFDGSFLLMGDSSAALGGVQFAVDYYDFHQLFVPNPRTTDAQCGFITGNDVHMGWRRVGGCPGQPVEILGSWVQAGFADTNMRYAPTDPKATMGTNTLLTEIGANAEMYGDFKLLQWDISNREAVAKPGMKAGTYYDWDVSSLGGADVALVSNGFNGYTIYSHNGTPTYGYGVFDPDQPTSYCGVDPAQFPPYKIYSSASTIVYNHTPGTWRGNAHPNDEAYGWFLCSRPPFRFYEFTVATGEDRGGWLISQPFTLPANGTFQYVQAEYAVPSTSISDGPIDLLAQGVAKRAARWAGYARGDVNDDGCVNLADVCWLQSGNQIYPDTYCGDVNIDGLVNSTDVTYLLQYVSGLGPAPLGKYRFTF